MASKVEAVVVGAGVVGLAIGRRLARAGREVLVLEKYRRKGEETSSRNSEVIHAGLYYKEKSKKAELCASSVKRMKRFCRDFGVDLVTHGKLVVSSSPSQDVQLFELHEHSKRLGVPDLQVLTSSDVRFLEPALRCSAALLSPNTAVVDSAGLLSALEGEVEGAGGVLAYGQKVEKLKKKAGRGFEVVMEDGYSVECDLLINSAGLFAQRLTESLRGSLSLSLRQGLDIPPPRFCKGSYFQYHGQSPFSKLIYPLPHPCGGGLGTHLTLDIGGGAKLGPDAQWIPAGLPLPDFPAQQELDPSGAFSDELEAEKLKVPHPVYWVDPARKALFSESVQRWWPSLDPDLLHPAYSGLRPKVPSGDFEISTHGMTGLACLYGIESPGLTCCLSLAREVTNVLGVTLQPGLLEEEREGAP